MRTEEYFKSVSKELEALKDRVRYIIDDGHWPTDGEWKESVLRTLIRRSAPTSYSVGRGFVVSGNNCSTQIDILIHDNAHPVLYRDGDLVFVSPAACKAVIEVKSNLNITTFRDACNGLKDVARLVRSNGVHEDLFVGLFSFEANDMNYASALNRLATITEANPRQIIDHIVLGPNTFIKWWSLTPNRRPNRHHDHWHAYNLPSMAAGYFLHNLLMHLSPHSERNTENIWFPEQSKEISLIAQQPLQLQPLAEG